MVQTRYTALPRSEGIYLNSEGRVLSFDVRVRAGKSC